MNKPYALQSGDRVAILSLSSGLLGEEFASHEKEIGTRRLKEYGLEPVFMPNSLKGIDYLSRYPEARAEDLKAAFADESIKGIICAIGGDDTYRLLPHLLEDKEFVGNVRRSPKLFTGFSDTTVNHLMFYKLGMESFYGPAFLCDLCEPDREMLPYTKRHFEGYFSGREIRCITSSETWYEERTDFGPAAVGTAPVSHREQHGFEALQGSGKITGRLLGGCLDSLYDILTGTRHGDEKDVCEAYGIFPEKEEWKGKILFLETSEERPSPDLFRVYLTALKERGVFDCVNGILAGKPQDETYYEEYKRIYAEVVADPELPILYNVNFGHAYPRCVLPYGIETEVDSDNGTITFLEPMFA